MNSRLKSIAGNLLFGCVRCRRRRVVQDELLPGSKAIFQPVDAAGVRKCSVRQACQVSLPNQHQIFDSRTVLQPHIS